MKTKFQEHLDAINSGIVTKSTVIGLRKTLNAYERIALGYSVSNTAPKAAYDGIALANMQHLIADKKPRVTGELHDSGIQLLTSKRYAKQLSKVDHITSNLSHFRLIGFEFIGNRLMQAYPIYRAFSESGNYFDFYVVPWQSGGNGPVIC
jgi:hypothetical protein